MGRKKLCLEYTVTRDSVLADEIRRRYISGHEFLYDRIVRLEQRNLKDTDTQWNFKMNVSFKSFKGLLVLWKNGKINARTPEKFVNAIIKKNELQRCAKRSISTRNETQTL